MSRSPCFCAFICSSARGTYTRTLKGGCHVNTWSVLVISVIARRGRRRRAVGARDHRSEQLRVALRPSRRARRGDQAILTVGDSVDGYRLVGIPDGLGAFDNGDGTFTLLVNHEIPGDQGVTRAHGAKGAFVSRWIVRKDDLAVVHGSDLIQKVATWNAATGILECSRERRGDVAPVFR